MVEARKASLDMRGMQFGPYTIVRRLGVGGMAETFEAIRLGPQGFSQRVCLKLALPFLREDKSFIRLFQREAKLAAKLRHSNIVGVLDYGSADGIPFMALELVDGVDLLRLLGYRGRLPYEQVALLAVELAKALHHAHSQSSSGRIEDSSTRLPGVVHRDLSPSNVMLSQQGEIMLADFGVAKAISRASRHQSAVKGKIPYMSPEQLRNEGVDGRSDLFSLGIVLFESLTGVRPFDGGNDPQTIMQILNGDRSGLSDEAHDAPEGFCRVVESLLEPDRDRRPASAAEVIERLDEFAPTPRVQRKLGGVVAKLRAEVLRGADDAPLDYDELVAGVPESGVVSNGFGTGGSTGQAKPREIQAIGSAALAAAVVVVMILGIALVAYRLL